MGTSQHLWPLGTLGIYDIESKHLGDYGGLLLMAIWGLGFGIPPPVLRFPNSEKIRATVSGVPLIRILVFWGLNPMS